MFCASAGFHIGLFFFMSVKTPGIREFPVQRAPEKTFSLINIALAEPAAASPEPRVVSRPPEPLPPPDTVPAEQYIVTEEEAGEGENREEAVHPVPAKNADAAGAVGAAAENAALTAEYITRNYQYLQRRIRDKLVYPAPARKAGIQGVAEVVFTIHGDGRAGAVTVRTSSGHAILDEAAVAAVLAAAPFPRPPAPARIAIPISFRLR
jgi:protein TonB